MYDLFADVQACLGDSDALACYMLAGEAVAAAIPFVPGMVDNVARSARHADDVGDVAQRVDAPKWVDEGYIGAERQLSAGTNIGGMAPQEYPRSVPRERGRHIRGAAGEEALEALYPGGRSQMTLETQWADRMVDWYVRRENWIYAHESKNYLSRVKGGSDILGEALKDWELIQTYRAVGVNYVPVWHFWDAPPNRNVARTLREFGIMVVIYNP